MSIPTKYAPDYNFPYFQINIFFKATLHYKSKIESIGQYYETLTTEEYPDISYMQIIDAGKDVKYYLHN